MKPNTLLEPTQIKSTRIGYDNLKDQLDYGRFASVKSGAAPTLYEEINATTDQVLFALKSGTFIKGDNSLQVYANGQLMREGADNDYVELSNQSVQFNFPLTERDVIVFRVNGGTSGASLHEDQKAAAGQLVFHLSTSYTAGNHSLVVYVNGAYQTLGIDYIETDAKTVTFLDPLDVNDLVTFRVEGLPTIQNKYQDSETITTYDNDERIIKEEVFGDSHIVSTYEYASDGHPSRMIIKEAGFTITKLYTWKNDLCVNIETKIVEGI